MTSSWLRATLTMAAILLAVPQTGWTCAVCLGDPNSAMSIGASWGILVLLGVVGGVLAAFASFFLYLMKRSRMAIGQRIELTHSSHAGSPS